MSGTKHVQTIVACAVLLGCASYAAANTWRVEQSGAVGDGITDDTQAIQRAIEHCYSAGYSTLALKAGAVYVLARRDSQSSLVLYKGDLTFDGHGATILDKRDAGGYWGDTLRVGGLVDGVPYPMAADGKTEIWHAGRDGNIEARHVKIRRLTIRHELAPANVNSIGIDFADDVSLEDVTSVRSPQSAFAIVSDSAGQPTTNVRLFRTHAIDSAYHAYRVSLQGDGNALSAVLSNCSSVGVRNAEKEYAPAEGIDGLRAHLWYRAASNSSAVNLTVDHCDFDASAQVVSTQGSHGLKIVDSAIRGGLHLARQEADRVELSGNRVGP